MWCIEDNHFSFRRALGFKFFDVKFPFRGGMRFLIDGRTDRDVHDFTSVHFNVGDVLHEMLGPLRERCILGQSRVP